MRNRSETKGVGRVSAGRGLARVARTLGVFAGFLALLMVLDWAVEQPHPVYVEPQVDGAGVSMRMMERPGVWAQILNSRDGGAGTAAGVVALMLAMGVGMGVEGLSGGLECRFYPVPGRMVRSLGCWRSRLVYEVGVLAAVGYVGQSLIEQWKLEQLPHGLIWPPDRVVAVGVWLWAVLWFGETVGRPARRCWVAAGVFLLLCFALCAVTGSGFLIE